MKNLLLAYLGKLIFEEYFLIPLLAGISLLTVWDFDSQEQGIAMLNQILPDFILLLSILVVSVGLLGLIIRILGFREEKRQKIRTKHDIYCEEVEIAFSKVSELFIKTQQNNIDVATKQEAWENIRLLHPALLKKRGEETIPTNPFDLGLKDVKAIARWYTILLDERIRCRQEKED